MDRKLTASRFVTIIPALMGCLACLPIGAHADEPPPPRIERVQLGDKQLTCDQIKAQYEEMGALIQKLDQKQADASAGMAGTTGQAAIGILGRMAPSLIPYAAGPAAQAAASAMFAQESNERTAHLMTQQNAQQRSQEAQARREHLMGLYDTKSANEYEVDVTASAGLDAQGRLVAIGRYQIRCPVLVRMNNAHRNHSQWGTEAGTETAFK
jgi:hypothetical protein